MSIPIFPSGIVTWTDKQDTIEADINSAFAEIIAVENVVASNTSQLNESMSNFSTFKFDGSDEYVKLQGIFDDASINNKNIVFPMQKTICISQPIRIKGNFHNYIFGNNCTLKLIMQTKSTDTPCLYFTTLTALGSSTKGSLEYNAGVTIYELNFDGVGYGVGYKHAIAGNLTLINCEFSGNLEVGVKLVGTNGVIFYNCEIMGNKKGVYCAFNKNDTGSINYTADSYGWNDGIHFVGGLIQTSNNGYGIYYEGSSAEAVVTIRNCIIAGSTNSVGVFAKEFTSFLVEGGWSEYFNGGIVFQIDVDETNYAPSNFEISHFTFSDYSGSRADRNIYTKAINSKIRDCFFIGNTNLPLIYASVPKLDIQLTSASPTFVTQGSPNTILGKYIADLGWSVFGKNMILKTNNNYYLKFLQKTSDNQFQYNVYTYTGTQDSGYNLTPYTGNIVVNIAQEWFFADESDNGSIKIEQNILYDDAGLYIWLETDPKSISIYKNANVYRPLRIRTP